jgi:hypothetical protein
VVGANKLSISFLTPIELAMAGGRTGFNGAGKNRDFYVHVRDLGRTYVAGIGVIEGKAVTEY